MDRVSIKCYGSFLIGRRDFDKSVRLSHKPAGLPANKTVPCRTVIRPFLMVEAILATK